MTSMNHSLSKRLVAILCLLAIGLGQMVIAPWVVRCMDGNGVSRVEFVCLKDSAGMCVAACAEDRLALTADNHHDKHDGSLPCEDEPVDSGSKVTSSRHVTSVVDHVEVAIPVAVLQSIADLYTRGREERCWDGLATRHPPGKVAQIRTVILIV